MKQAQYRIKDLPKIERPTLSVRFIRRSPKGAGGSSRGRRRREKL